MTEIRRGQARIACRVEGEGPPVLLLASLGRGAEDYAAVAGGSPPPASGWSGRSRAASAARPGRWTG